VAVCLAGGVRTLVRPHVHRSIAENLLGGLEALVHVFAVLRLGDVAPKGDAAHAREHSSVDASRAELRGALTALAPFLRALYLDDGDAPEGERAAYGVRRNPRCAMRGFMGRSAAHEMRSVAQPASWAVCMALIERAEHNGAEQTSDSRARGRFAHGRAEYDWVVRALHLHLYATTRKQPRPLTTTHDHSRPLTTTHDHSRPLTTTQVRARPDAYWFAAHPAACALRPLTTYVHIWNDHHFVLPRGPPLGIAFSRNLP